MHALPLIDRVRAEFIEMPELRLTTDQVRRFCGVDPRLVEHVLDALVTSKFLYCDARGCYKRVTDVAPPTLAA